MTLCSLKRFLDWLWICETSTLLIPCTPLPSVPSPFLLSSFPPSPLPSFPSPFLLLFFFSFFPIPSSLPFFSQVYLFLIPFKTSSIVVLREMISDYKRRGVEVCLTRTSQHILEKFRVSDYVSVLGQNRIHTSIDDAVFVLVQHQREKAQTNALVWNSLTKLSHSLMNPSERSLLFLFFSSVLFSVYSRNILSMYSLILVGTLEVKDENVVLNVP